MICVVPPPEKKKCEVTDPSRNDESTIFSTVLTVGTGAVGVGRRASRGKYSVRGYRVQVHELAQVVPSTHPGNFPVDFSLSLVETKKGVAESTTHPL